VALSETIFIAFDTNILRINFKPNGWMFPGVLELAVFGILDQF
jgi:hypothetical protein